MKKKASVIKVKGSVGLAKTNTDLRNAGYSVLEPSMIYHDNDGVSMDAWEQTISARTCSGDNNKNAALIHSSAGNEQMEDSCGTKGLGWMEWGYRNLKPNYIATLTELLPYTAAGQKFNTDLCAGLGPKPMYRYTKYEGGSLVTKEIPFADAGVLIKGIILDLQKQVDATGNADGGACKMLKEQIEGYKQQYEVWERTNNELKDFLDHNNLGATYLQLAGDQQLLGICFPEIELQKSYIDPKSQKPVLGVMWRPKAVGLKYRPAHICRLERMDKNNRINYVYMSNRWYDSREVSSVENVTDICAVRALTIQSPLADMKEDVRNARQSNATASERPTRFILPSYYPTPGHPYYPVLAWHSIFAGYLYNYMATIISDRYIRRKNSNIIGRVIYIHQDYLRVLYEQSGCQTEEAKRDKLKSIFNEINSWLSNRDNSGQSLVAFSFIGPDGKEHESYKIVEIESASKNAADANEKELAEVSSIIFFAQGLDARLIGNTPGTESSGGGTDLRERYLLKQIQMSPTQQILKQPLEVISRFNDWDEHLVWTIKREVLTTLDNSKTGITESEQ